MLRNSVDRPKNSLRAISRDRFLYATLNANTDTGASCSIRKDSNRNPLTTHPDTPTTNIVKSG